MTNTAKVITSGNISGDAEAWLISHECQIELSLGLSIILLSIEAEVARGAYGWQYFINFYDAEGEYEPQYCEVELDIDAYETRVTLKKSA